MSDCLSDSETVSLKARGGSFEYTVILAVTSLASPARSGEFFFFGYARPIEWGGVSSVDAGALGVGAHGSTPYVAQPPLNSPKSTRRRHPDTRPACLVLVHVITRFPPVHTFFVPSLSGTRISTRRPRNYFCAQLHPPDQR